MFHDGCFTHVVIIIILSFWLLSAQTHNLTAAAQTTTSIIYPSNIQNMDTKSDYVDIRFSQRWKKRWLVLRPGTASTPTSTGGLYIYASHKEYELLSHSSLNKCHAVIHHPTKSTRGNVIILVFQMDTRVSGFSGAHGSYSSSGSHSSSNSSGGISSQTHAGSGGAAGGGKSSDPILNKQGLMMVDFKSRKALEEWMIALATHRYYSSSFSADVTGGGNRQGGVRVYSWHALELPRVRSVGASRTGSKVDLHGRSSDTGQDQQVDLEMQSLDEIEHENDQADAEIAGPDETKDHPPIPSTTLPPKSTTSLAPHSSRQSMMAGGIPMSAVGRLGFICLTQPSYDYDWWMAAVGRDALLIPFRPSPAGDTRHDKVVQHQQQYPVQKEHHFGGSRDLGVMEQAVDLNPKSKSTHDGLDQQQLGPFPDNTNTSSMGNLTPTRRKRNSIPPPLTISTPPNSAPLPSTISASAMGLHSNFTPILTGTGSSSHDVALMNASGDVQLMSGYMYKKKLRGIVHHSAGLASFLHGNQHRVSGGSLMSPLMGGGNASGPKDESDEDAVIAKSPPTPVDDAVGQNAPPLSAPLPQITTQSVPISTHLVNHPTYHARYFVLRGQRLIWYQDAREYEVIKMLDLRDVIWIRCDVKVFGVGESGPVSNNGPVTGENQNSQHAPSGTESPPLHQQHDQHMAAAASAPVPVQQHQEKKTLVQKLMPKPRPKAKSICIPFGMTPFVHPPATLNVVTYSDVGSRARSHSDMESPPTPTETPMNLHSNQLDTSFALAQSHATGQGHAANNNTSLMRQLFQNSLVMNANGMSGQAYGHHNGQHVQSPRRKKTKSPATPELYVVMKQISLSSDATTTMMEVSIVPQSPIVQVSSAGQSMFNLDTPLLAQQSEGSTMNPVPSAMVSVSAPVSATPSISSEPPLLSPPSLSGGHGDKAPRKQSATFPRTSPSTLSNGVATTTVGPSASGSGGYVQSPLTRQVPNETSPTVTSSPLVVQQVIYGSDVDGSPPQSASVGMAESHSMLSTSSPLSDHHVTENGPLPQPESRDDTQLQRRIKLVMPSVEERRVMSGDALMAMYFESALDRLGVSISNKDEEYKRVIQTALGALFQLDGSDMSVLSEDDVMEECTGSWMRLIQLAGLDQKLKQGSSSNSVPSLERRMQQQRALDEEIQRRQQQEQQMRQRAVDREKEQQDRVTELIQQLHSFFHDLYQLLPMHQTNISQGSHHVEVQDEGKKGQLFHIRLVDAKREYVLATSRIDDFIRWTIALRRAWLLARLTE